MFSDNNFVNPPNYPNYATYPCNSVNNAYQYPPYNPAYPNSNIVPQFRTNCSTCSFNNNGVYPPIGPSGPNRSNGLYLADSNRHNKPKSNNCKCNKCRKNKTSNCESDCESEKCEIIEPRPVKSMCPTKSYCDPALANTCSTIPFIDPFAPPHYVTTWKVNYIVSSNSANNVTQNTPMNVQPRSQRTIIIDPNLASPLGIVIYENQIYVANSMSDTITVYDLFGNPVMQPIQIRQNARVVTFPAGVAINCQGGFTVPAPGALDRPATLLTATKSGDICVYSEQADPIHTYVVISNKESGEIAEYTGLAIANNTLYLANFYGGHIDVFGQNFLRVLGFRFVDDFATDPIPQDFGPFNIVYIAPYLYVVYAERAPGNVVYHLNGIGAGYISVFNLDGSFVRRFYSRGVLNAPYSIIPAPCECGIPSGSFLVNNIGDGRINMFDSNGYFLGPLLSQAGLPISITGISSMAPYYTTFNQIFFTATEDENNSGLLGNIVKDQVLII